MQTSDILSIGQLAERTGLAVSAIRHYEAEGLVHPVRSGGGQRRFRRSDIRRLSFVLITRNLGFTLAEIRAQLDRLPDARTPSPADWKRISRTFRWALNERIAALTRLRDGLDRCIGCGCLLLDQCRLVNSEDAASRHGPGPRYWMGNVPD